MSGDISIIIPCYNHGEFLGETIASVERVRTDRLREVILVDDGSTDPGTQRVLEEIERSGYRVIRQANRGVGAARNTGIREAAGRYILPLDSDNRIRRPYLGEAAEKLDSDPELGVVYGNAEYFGDRSGIWHVAEFSFRRLATNNFIDNCALYRREMWEEISGYDERMPACGWEDWDFWLRAAIKGWGFAHLNLVAFEYRVRVGSMLSGASKAGEAILKHMFSKPELAAIGLLRGELRRLGRIERSPEYRIGRGMLSPFRRVQRIARRMRPPGVTRPTTGPATAANA